MRTSRIPFQLWNDDPSVLDQDWPPLCINRPRHLYSDCCKSTIPKATPDWQENLYSTRVKTGYIYHSKNGFYRRHFSPWCDLPSEETDDEMGELIHLFAKLTITSDTDTETMVASDHDHDYDTLSNSNEDQFFPDENNNQTEFSKQKFHGYLEDLLLMDTMDQFFNDLGFYSNYEAHFDCFYEQVFEEWKENDDADDYYSCPCYCYLDPLKDCDH
jgi:hypothetical protein